MVEIHSWKGTRGITCILRLFSRVVLRKYRQNMRGRRALTAIHCVNDSSYPLAKAIEHDSLCQTFAALHCVRS